MGRNIRFWTSYVLETFGMGAAVAAALVVVISGGPLLFAVNCAGFQLLPATVLALRAQSGAADPYSVYLPILLASLSALLLGAVLVRVVYGIRGRLRKPL